MDSFLRGSIVLTTDKITYAPDETIVVTLYNGLDAAIFLDGCNPLYFATRVDTGWRQSSFLRCDAEPTARRIDSGKSYEERYPAVDLNFCGKHKFVAYAHLDCLQDTPLSEANCDSLIKVHSPEFAVTGYEDAAGNLRIFVDKLEYTWDATDLGTSKEIRARLFNHSNRVYYATLGDWFNESIDQENLFIAEGSDGFIEKYAADGSWVAMPRGLLIEGVRAVALRPGEKYSLTASLYPWQGNETGFFRIKVVHFDSLDPVAGKIRMVDYSHVFSIR